MGLHDRLARRRPMATLLAVAGLVCLPLLWAGAGVSASSPNPNQMVAVPQGMGPAVIQGLSPFGTTPPSTRETVSFVLQGRNLQPLEAQVEAGSKTHLSVQQFSQQYGQTDQAVQALERYLAGYRISAAVYPGNLDVVANGTAGEFDAALTVQQHQYHVPARPGSGEQHGLPAQTIHATPQSPMLPYSIAGTVLAILGLDNYGSFVDQVVAPAATRVSSPQATAPLDQLPSAVASEYDLSPLIRQGIDGAGQTIGIVSLASVDPTVPAYFWSNVADVDRTGTLTLENVDGGAGPVSLANGSVEPTIDVEQSGALAPAANIVIYQAPNTDYGFADAFFDAASQDVAGSVSASWGSSETIVQAAINSDEESPAYVEAYDEAFLELAAQGQATFVSAADYGAYTAIADLGTTNLSVDSPADSPYVTAAGGTTLPGTQTYATGISVTVSAQRAWGWDYLWPVLVELGAYPTEADAAFNNPLGGGGGYSVDEQTPSYQQGVPGLREFSAVEYLTPIDYEDVDGMDLPTSWAFNPTPRVTQGFGQGRALPDLSLDADPQTGYIVYDPQLVPVYGSALLDYGGTSFVAPQLAAVDALYNQFIRGRTGFWNPSIYSFAEGRNSPFTPLTTPGTSNDNLYYSGTPGKIYNPATGLGYPDLYKLALDFAGSRY